MKRGGSRATPFAGRDSLPQVLHNLFGNEPAQAKTRPMNDLFGFGG
jgi:hypothetical protein